MCGEGTRRVTVQPRALYGAGLSGTLVVPLVSDFLSPLLAKIGAADYT